MDRLGLVGYIKTVTAVVGAAQILVQYVGLVAPKGNIEMNIYEIVESIQTILDAKMNVCLFNKTITK